MDFSHSRKIYSKNTGKAIGYCYKNRTRCCKNCFQKNGNKTVETTGELIRNKIAGKIVEPKSVSDSNSQNIEKTVIPLEKTQEIFNKLRQVLLNGTPWTI